MREGWSWRRVAGTVVVTLVYGAVLVFLVEGLGVTSRREGRAILRGLMILGVLAGVLFVLVRPQSRGRRARRRGRPWMRRSLRQAADSRERPSGSA